MFGFFPCYLFCVSASEVDLSHSFLLLSLGIDRTLSYELEDLPRFVLTHVFGDCCWLGSPTNSVLSLVFCGPPFPSSVYKIKSLSIRAGPSASTWVPRSVSSSSISTSACLNPDLRYCCPQFPHSPGQRGSRARLFYSIGIMYIKDNCQCQTFIQFCPLLIWE